MSRLEPVGYADSDTALTGWLAWPAGTPRAAIAVFPSVHGRTAHSDDRVTRLTEAGYLAMSADYYGSGIDGTEAVQAAGQALRADLGGFRARAAAAVTALAGLPAAAGLPRGAIGFCQGGMAVLELARAGTPLKAVASFHGLLQTQRPAEAPIAARILVCHGDADPMVPREAVLAFWEEMDAAGADWHFHSYARVLHGFTDPASDGRPSPAVGYDPSADRQSWAAMLAFFDEVFGAQPA
jgi:dienelactone hydrolase